MPLLRSTRTVVMANANPPSLPAPTPEHRRVAAGQFEHANQVIATRKNYDYGIRLLLSCCKLDPANLIYRQTLRRTQRAKYNNNMKGGWLAWLRTWPIKARVKSALRKRDYQLVLEHAERVLVRNPWDVGTQMDLAAAADALGLLDVAVWSLEQARHKDPRKPLLNRTLAELYERRGNFTQAIALWEMVRKALPGDLEAEAKVKDLAASDTIARGHYQEAVGTAPPSEDETGGLLQAEPSTPSTSATPVVRPKPETVTHPLFREAETLRERTKTDPTNPNGWMQLAALHRRADQLDQARAVLMEGLGPTGNSFHLTLELTDLDIEPFRRDLAVAEEKLKAEPSSKEINRIRQRLSKEINTRELELHRMKADRFPTEMIHRYEVGVRLLQAGQIDEAISELQAARSDQRLYWQTVLHLGYCFKARNNWRLAKRNFEDALRNLPTNEKERRKEIQFLLAEGSAANGELEHAVELGHELANEDFGYHDIGHLLDEWEARLRQEKAVK
jgi:tetratricopeptide (TPR) repeat protein